MADIELVIKISENIYHFIKTHFRVENEVDMAILNGTPLPKGHGRLIDANALLDTDRLIVDSMKCHYIPMMDIYDAPTIIEADGAESEDKND